MVDLSGRLDFGTGCNLSAVGSYTGCPRTTLVLEETVECAKFTSFTLSRTKRFNVMPSLTAWTSSIWKTNAIGDWVDILIEVKEAMVVDVLGKSRVYIASIFVEKDFQFSGLIEKIICKLHRSLRNQSFRFRHCISHQSV